MLRQIQSECEDSCCHPLQEDDVELTWDQVQHHAYERPRMMAADKDDNHRKEADRADDHKPTAKKRPQPPLVTAKQPKLGHVAMSIRTIMEAPSSWSLVDELADIVIDELSPLEEIE